MTREQIAKMFGEAKRSDLYSTYFKRMQQGLYSLADNRNIKPKPCDFYLKQQMDPASWKSVTKSQFSLKSKPFFVNRLCAAFKQSLSKFRNEQRAKRRFEYIPVTMDELMARFTTNIEREKNAQTFSQAQQFLWQNSLQQFSREQIEAGIEKTVSSMEKLLATNTITQQRMPNSENRLYLELVERV